MPILARQVATGQPVDIGLSNQEGTSDEIARADHVHKFPVGAVGALFLYNQELLGTKNGSNLTFSTPSNFVAGAQRVFRNGVLQRVGALNDYSIAESGGVGSGYDTIVFVGMAPLSWENLLVNYVVA